MIVKSAFDWKLGAHALHFETAGLLRTFKVFDNLVTPNATNAITEGSGSVNLNFEVLRNFHLMANTFYGAGNGPLRPTERFHHFTPGRASLDLNIR